MVLGRPGGSAEVISGVVTGMGVPLGGVQVAAVSTITNTTVLSTTSAPNGTYQLRGLYTGSYRVRFTAAGYTTRYSSSATSAATAPLISVTDGSTTPSVNTDLAWESLLTGAVSTPKPVAVTVAARLSTGEVVTSVDLAHGGTFSLGGLGNLPYQVVMSGPGMRTVILGPYTPPAGQPLAIRSGANLNGAPLAAASLTYANLTGADLTNADLTNADLTGANLTNVVVAGTTLTGATFTGVTSGGMTGTPKALSTGRKVAGGFLLAPGVSAQHATLAGAALGGVNVSGADLTGADLTGANLSSANLTNATITGATISGATFTGATMVSLHTGGLVGAPAAISVNVHVVGGYFLGPNFSYASADLRGIHGDGINLSGSSFTAADATGATFVGANFTGASMRGNFSGVDLTNANLTNARLDILVIGTDGYSATLTGATITGTKFTGAQLSGTFSGSLVGAPATLPARVLVRAGYLLVTHAALQHADFSGLDLSGVDLTSADLTDANFAGSNLTNASLANAIVTGANFTGANISGANLSTSSLASAQLSGFSGTPSALPVGWIIVNGHVLGGFGPSLANVDLSGAYLQGLNLEGVDLRGARLAERTWPAPT